VVRVVVDDAVWMPLSSCFAFSQRDASGTYTAMAKSNTHAFTAVSVSLSESCVPTCRLTSMYTMPGLNIVAFGLWCCRCHGTAGRCLINALGESKGGLLNWQWQDGRRGRVAGGLEWCLWSCVSDRGVSFDGARELGAWSCTVTLTELDAGWEA
jgi:hypothetical protein